MSSWSPYTISTGLQTHCSQTALFLHVVDPGAMLAQQEEEEWQEVLAKQDSFQQAAEPARDAVQATSYTGNSPRAVHGPGALDSAEAPVLSDAVSRDSKSESMQPDANTPAAEDQPDTITVSSTVCMCSKLRELICSTRQQCKAGVTLLASTVLRAAILACTCWDVSTGMCSMTAAYYSIHEFCGRAAPSIPHSSTSIARGKPTRHVGCRWLIHHSTACVCSKHVLVQKKALFDCDSCKMQAVEGSSVMLQSGVGLLRKAEVDAHRKVTMQVCASHGCWSRKCM